MALTPSSTAQLVTLTPQQFRQYSSLTGGEGGATASADGNGYTVPLDTYTTAYNGFANGNKNQQKARMSLPDPASYAPAVAAPTTSPIKTFAAPTYDQFVQQQASRGPVIYNGGAAPAGMNAADASVLQGIYNPPAKADGGFVSPNGGFGAPQHFSEGGMPTGGEMASWVTRRQAAESVPHGAGLFASSVPGRTDKLDTIVPAGSYVIPADVVSGLGEGNTMAGSNILDKMFHTNPYGIQGARVGHGGVGIPGIPHHMVASPRANGGATPTRIIAAGGEYLIHPEDVKRIGGGDLKRGHKILDHFVVHARKTTAATMNKLPGPKK